MTVKNISQELLRSCYSYSIKTGEFKHLSGSKAGLVAGYIHQTGYRIVYFDGMRYSAHRLAWTYIYGEIPLDHVIDHINGVRHDNRLCNLRAVLHAENMQNIGVKHTSSRLQKNIKLGKTPK